MQTGVDFADVKDSVAFHHLVYCGAIDALRVPLWAAPYRSVEFRHRTLDQEWFQPVATVNYPAKDIPFTRITEFKHLPAQLHRQTSIVYEYPRAEGDPCYPVPNPENQKLFKRYEALALATPNVTFVGRLATYRYYNMDQVVGQALATWRRLAAAELKAGKPAGAIGAALRPRI